MARVSKNHLLEGSQGAVGKKIVYKIINGKTFACQYPDMSQVQYNESQKTYRSLFAQAVKYAKDVLNDPEKMQQYADKQRKHKDLRATSIYHLAIKDFLNKNSKKHSKQKIEKLLQQSNNNFNLTDRQALALQHLIREGSLTNSIYQQINQVSKATATRDLQDLVQQGILKTHSKGAGAAYELIGS